MGVWGEGTVGEGGAGVMGCGIMIFRLVAELMFPTYISVVFPRKRELGSQRPSAVLMNRTFILHLKSSP